MRALAGMSMLSLRPVHLQGGRGGVSLRTIAKIVYDPERFLSLSASDTDVQCVSVQVCERVSACVRDMRVRAIPYIPTPGTSS